MASLSSPVSETTGSSSSPVHPLLQDSKPSYDPALHSGGGVGDDDHPQPQQHDKKTENEHDDDNNDDDDYDEDYDAMYYGPLKQYHTVVEYDGDNHLQVLFQMYGSVWLSVFPWCIATCLFTGAVIYLRAIDVVDLTITNTTGHTFMSLLVSFLLVTRATITYNRFMEARQHLSDLYRTSRELVQYACVLTASNTNAEARQWRQGVAYKTIVTLRMAQAAVEFRSSGVTAWETQQHADDADSVDLALDPSWSPPPGDNNNNREDSNKVGDDDGDDEGDDADTFWEEMAHGKRTAADDNFRAPIVWSFNLRQQILRTRTDPSILPTKPMHVNEELKLLQLVQDFIAAYHGHRKLITTPFPFPMVQMARTFLFFWVFSLPLVLIPDADNDKATLSYTIHDTVEVLLIIFFCTYGFLGLEYVSMELDDPYGDDPNDFPGQRWSALAFDDIYCTVAAQDGVAAAAAVQSRILERVRRGGALELWRQEDKRFANNAQSVRPGTVAPATAAAAAAVLSQSPV